VELKFFPENLMEVEVFFENKSFGMAKPVDVIVNSQVGRNWDSEKTDKNKEKKIEIVDPTSATPSVPKSGMLSFAEEEGK
jgi:hypothetical protein